MLEVGNGDITDEENRAHFAMWAMLAAPLMAGNDLRTMRDDVRDVLCAREVIALDQDAAGEQARRLSRERDVELWCRRTRGGEVIVAALNHAAVSREAVISARAVGVDGRARARDLWNGPEMTDFHDEAVVTIRAHSATLLGIAPY
jgi:alpha-galactosidase